MSFFNVSLIGLLLLVVVLVQAKPLRETSDGIIDDKSPVDSQQLYDLYKMMRMDPRLASLTNDQLVLHLYRNFVLGKGDINALKRKQQKQYNNQQANLVE